MKQPKKENKKPVLSFARLITSLSSSDHSSLRFPLPSSKQNPNSAEKALGISSTDDQTMTTSSGENSVERYPVHALCSLWFFLQTLTEILIWVVLIFHNLFPVEWHSHKLEKMIYRSLCCNDSVKLLLYHVGLYFHFCWGLLLWNVNCNGFIFLVSSFLFII